MIDFSALSRDTRLGRMLRRVLALVPREAVVPVLQGRLRGARWIVGSSVHSCWLGNYEYPKQRALVQHLRPGQVFYDVGANAGFYTLLGSRCVGERGQVHSFEPLPANLELLRRHVALNHADNVHIHDLALAAEEGVARFACAASRAEGRLSADGDYQVRTTTIDHLVAEGLRPPDVIKMDIEGAEDVALAGARDTLARHHPLVLVATHGEEPHRTVVALLQDLRYRVRTIQGATEDELLASAGA